ncbi:MAG: DUF2279 domain-containing protein [Bacteroidota bacterium]
MHLLSLLRYTFFLVFIGISCQLQAQQLQVEEEMMPRESIDKDRLTALVVGGGTAYATSSILLYETWYSRHPRRSFHFRDDWGQWGHMDKLGHVFSSYFQTESCADLFRWTGVSESKALLYGALSSSLFQTTVEVMDGFSSEWGFSMSDIGANVIGTGTYLLQEKFWDDQRIRWKYSVTPIDYQNTVGSDVRLQNRVDDLFGTGFFERGLKDYNAQTYWLSANLSSFFPDRSLPSWLSVAVGYGIGHTYGGYLNEWVDQGQLIRTDDDIHPRHAQFYLSLDADLSKVHVNSPFLRALLDVLNVLKVPFSTIEVNTLGEVKLHLVRF